MVMPSDVKGAGHRIRGVAAAEQALPVLDPALANLAAQAIRTRKGQGIGLTLDGHEAAYIVRAGALMLQVAAGATPAKSLPFCFLATCSEVAQFRPTPRRA